MPREYSLWGPTRAGPKPVKQLVLVSERVPVRRKKAAPRKLDGEAGYDRHLRRTYGITHEDYDAMFAAQGGLCAICGLAASRMTGRKRTMSARLHVDHDHETGRVRALLCSKCNIGIGCFERETTLLEKAVEYMQKYASTRSETSA